MTLGLVGCWFGDPAVVMFPQVKRRSGGSGLPDFTPFLLMLPPPPHEKLGIVLALRRGTMGLLLLFFGPTIDVWTHRRMDGRRPLILVFRADGWTHRRLDPPTVGPTDGRLGGNFSLFPSIFL